VKKGKHNAFVTYIDRIQPWQRLPHTSPFVDLSWVLVGRETIFNCKAFPLNSIAGKIDIA
jgi:hypothetical protein